MGLSQPQFVPAPGDMQPHATPLPVNDVPVPMEEFEPIGVGRPSSPTGDAPPGGSPHDEADEAPTPEALPQSQAAPRGSASAKDNVSEPAVEKRGNSNVDEGAIDGPPQLPRNEVPGNVAPREEPSQEGRRAVPPLPQNTVPDNVLPQEPPTPVRDRRRSSRRRHNLLADSATTAPRKEKDQLTAKVDVPPADSPGILHLCGQDLSELVAGEAVVIETSGGTQSDRLTVVDRLQVSCTQAVQRPSALKIIRVKTAEKPSDTVER